MKPLLISVLFEFALHSFGGRGTLVPDLMEKSSHVLFALWA
jgi:aerobic C4-dicarboxylate transport protein